MQTPAGKECRYFYGDYHRGRHNEECRLLVVTDPPQKWTPDLCFTCPVPDILQANACPHLILEGTVRRPFFLLKRRVEINASCSRTLRHGFEPRVGCGDCHILPPIFSGEPRDSDTTD